MMTLPLVFVLILVVQGLEFDLPSHGKKCLFYNFDKDDIAHGTYKLANKHYFLQINLVVLEMRAPGDVTDAKEVSRKNDIPDQGTFAFTSKGGDQEICFEVVLREGSSYGWAGNQMRVDVVITEKELPKREQNQTKLTAVDKSLNTIADEVTKMKRLTKKLHKGLEERNALHEQADTGLGRLSLLFFFILILFGGGQVFYLKHFLTKKKLI